MELNGAGTDIFLSYRSDHIHKSLALEAAETLELAICYLLQGGSTQSSGSLYNDFFYYRTGAHAQEVESAWRARVEGLEPSPFPAVPYSLRKPPNSTATFKINDVLLNGGEPETTAIIWTAWGSLMADYTNTDDVVFGGVLQPASSASYLPADLVSIAPPPTSPSIVPVCMKSDDEMSVADALKEMEGYYNEVARLRRVSRHWISQLGEYGKRACAFQTMLHVCHAEHAGQEPCPNSPEMCEDTSLHLTCLIQDGSLYLTTWFDDSVIGRGEMQLIARQFGHIIRQLARADSNTVISAIKASGEGDLADIWSWNAMVPETVEACVHDLFAEVARKQPDAPAICSWDGDLVYRQVDDLSSRLAVYLTDLGVGPGDIIPLCFEKSKWTSVAMLGVMKAGAASVAMDAANPEARLRSIVQQAHAHSNRRLIISSRLSEISSHNLAAQAGFDAEAVPVIVAETVSQNTSNGAYKPAAQSQRTRVRPDDILYVVFTSGSTGIPKGAMISHRNFSSAIRHQAAYSGLDSSSRVLDFAPYTFDAAWVNTWYSLICGGCLCIPSEEGRQSHLAQSIRHLRANHLNITPTAARTITPEDITGIRSITFAGEKLRPSDVSLWAGVAAVRNSYGTAECTVANTISTILRSSPDQKSFGDPVIGRGCGAVTWVVRMDGAALAAVGAIGELWLEGPLVGLGYLANPKQTEEAFRQDPPWLLHGGGPGAPGRRGRLYRTGDLVRYQPNGSLQFIGRKDDQVKIRGQRVELGDVESHVKRMLPSKPDIQVIAEVVAPDGSPSPLLVAFVCPLGHSTLSSEDHLKLEVAELTRGLHDKLLQYLPQHMIPSTYVPIAAIPTTLTGKIDRKRLRKMGQTLNLSELVDSSNVRPPANDLESTIVQCWANILDIPYNRISTDIPFTRLGGDSISAMQLVASLHAHQIHITVGAILRHLTIQKIAPACQVLMENSTNNSSYEEIGHERAWVLSPIQRIFFSAHPDGLNHFNQSFLLQMQEAFTADQLRSAAMEVVSRHPMLRARFRRRDANAPWEQYILPNSQENFLFTTGKATSRAAIEASVRSRQDSLDIINGPVFTIDYFHPGDNGKITILFVAHHLVVDLVSWRIIWHDIEQLLRGRPLAPNNGTSFRRWTAIQEKLGREVTTEQALPFQLESRFNFWGVKPSANVLGAAEDCHVHLDLNTTTILLGRCNVGLRTEPTDIMVAVLIHSLCHLFPDRPTPAIFVEGHGREALDDTSVDLSETVGWFTSLCPVQIPLSQDTGIVEAVKLVKDTRRKIPGKGLPWFASLHKECTTLSKVHNSTAAEFLFNYGGIFQQLEGRNNMFRRVEANIPEASSSTRRMALVEINASVVEGALHVIISIHRRMKYRQRLVQWASDLGDSFRHATQTLVDITTSPTLSDFPLLPLSYKELDAMMTELESIGIRLEDIVDLLPCTPLQEGILLGIARGTASYRIVQVWDCNTMKGEQVDASKLELAWKTAVGRHSIFTMVFVESAHIGRFIQVQLQPFRVPVRVQHLPSGVGSPAENLAAMEGPAFHSDQPPYTITICQSATGEVACRLDISHAIIDALSFPILLADVKAAYDRGNQTTQTATEFRYALKEVVRVSPETKWEYWIKYLHGVEPCRVPTYARLDSNSTDEYHVDITVPLSVTESISSYCRARNITRSTFLQVSWAMALSQLMSKVDVCFGYLASGRDLAVEGVEGIVGPFITTLVSRISLGSSVASVLAETAQGLAAHFDYQHVSLAKLQAGLSLHGEQLFNTAMTIRQAIGDSAESGENLQLKSTSGSNTNEVCIAYWPSYGRPH